MGQHTSGTMMHSCLPIAKSQLMLWGADSCTQAGQEARDRGGDTSSICEKQPWSMGSCSRCHLRDFVCSGNAVPGWEPESFRGFGAHCCPAARYRKLATSSVLMKWLAADCQAASRALRALYLQAGLALASCCYLGLLPLAELASIVDDAVCAINSSSPDPPRPGFNSAVIVCTIEMYLKGMMLTWSAA